MFEDIVFDPGEIGAVAEVDHDIRRFTFQRALVKGIRHAENRVACRFRRGGDQASHPAFSADQDLHKSPTFFISA